MATYSATWDAFPPISASTSRHHLRRSSPGKRLGVCLEDVAVPAHFHDGSPAHGPAGPAHAAAPGLPPQPRRPALGSELSWPILDSWGLLWYQTVHGLWMGGLSRPWLSFTRVEKVICVALGPETGTVSYFSIKRFIGAQWNVGSRWFSFCLWFDWAGPSNANPNPTDCLGPKTLSFGQT